MLQPIAHRRPEVGRATIMPSVTHIYYALPQPLPRFGAHAMPCDADGDRFSREDKDQPSEPDRSRRSFLHFAASQNQGKADGVCLDLVGRVVRDRLFQTYGCWAVESGGRQRTKTLSPALVIVASREQAQSDDQNDADQYLAGVWEARDDSNRSQVPYSYQKEATRVEISVDLVPPFQAMGSDMVLACGELRRLSKRATGELSAVIDIVQTTHSVLISPSRRHAGTIGYVNTLMPRYNCAR
ncbi:hypothetical protein P152DRAFT_516149 [Eremomyces bilateralis CBS 781.70]|uniref:Uncharacterized protein n=1 Tax=Eremomyces bilateralis CBS 781.70 TaxID=1392243 RepID=A0A6G1FX76_9PEZI|nr:uncharacterized protein P152DRAFT_516149 [Eremomyces bilateralis CBS 781.70]KAF1810280.1 hypothetical protein P152DRAFT_516149 [Eremomyces bilateralis CBS 781.70]